MQFALYTILYTRPGQEVKKNEYIWIYLTWLWSLIHHNVLGPDDSLSVCIDQSTFEFLKKQYGFHYLHTLNKLKCKYIHIDQPSSVLDGFFNKYNPKCIDVISSQHTDLSKTIFIYSDIDNMIVKPLNTLSWKENTNIFYPAFEGPIQNKTYFGGYDPLPEEIEIYNVINKVINSSPPNSIPGFSAGLFAFSFESKERILYFMENIYKYKNYQKDKDIYYEQCAFNFNIYSNIVNNRFEVCNAAFNTHGVLIFNDMKNTNYSILSLMGDAGNESLHMDKCMSFLFIQLELSKRS
jgi:hypothetical protein